MLCSLSFGLEQNRDNCDVLVYSLQLACCTSDVCIPLLRARAIENQSYVIGVNWTGTDGNGISTLGIHGDPSEGGI
jgi:predicted amidohydrolase